MKNYDYQKNGLRVAFKKKEKKTLDPEFLKHVAKKVKEQIEKKMKYLLIILFLSCSPKFIPEYQFQAKVIGIKSEGNGRYELKMFSKDTIAKRNIKFIYVKYSEVGMGRISLKINDKVTLQCTGEFIEIDGKRYYRCRVKKNY